MELKFNNGKFRIMHVTDTHLEDYNLESSVWAIGEACDIEKPDIVIMQVVERSLADFFNQATFK